MNKKLILILSIVFVLVLLLVLFKEKDYTKTDQNKQLNSSDSFSKEQLDSIDIVKKEKLLDARKSNTIDARALMNAYTENEINADNSFKDKTFYVEGIIEDIGKDILNNIFVTLKTNEVLGTIQCYIEDADKVAKLKKGEKITVYGKCKGKVLFNIAIEKGIVVENL